jgi:UDP-N-acetylglucosamine 1-carboxyvinyltransferase
MDVLKIKGGRPLEGTVRAAGAKNAVTKLLVASLLSDKRCRFYNVPNIAEVEVTVALCKEIGSEVHWDRTEGIIEIVTKELNTCYVPQRFSGSNRIPILMIGALLGRTDQDIIVPTAGGCKIGKRPVDFHLSALEKLGAQIEYREMKKEGAYFARAHHGLKGAIIHLPFPSVGATENSILAACRASGTTIIKNAATEPEIIDLILFLQKLGVTVGINADRAIHIEETHQFYDVEHTVITDRIEAASLGLAAISTKGRVFVEGAQHPHMITFLNKLREVNAGFEVKKEGIEFFYKGPLKGGVHIETDVHPGFLTDWQQPFVVLLTQAHGLSIVHETIYENRFGYTQTLRQMGADIESFTHCLGGKTCRFASQNFYHSIVVKGATPLCAKDITIPDLRAGFAYVMAAMLAPDESRISGLQYLDRGYENIVGKLSSLGAEISREIPSSTTPKTSPESSFIPLVASMG